MSCADVLAERCAIASSNAVDQLVAESGASVSHDSACSSEIVAQSSAGWCSVVVVRVSSGASAGVAGACTRATAVGGGAEPQAPSSAAMYTTDAPRGRV